MSKQKEKIYCIGCDNEAIIAFENESWDEPEFCPFCGCSLDETIDELIQQEFEYEE